MTQNKNLARKIKQCSQLTGAFKLRSGEISDTYFDKYLFESEPKLLREICEAMADMIPAETEVLAGLEMGGIPIATVLSQVTGLPTAFIRKEAKQYGTCKYAEGAKLVGRKVVIIEDVVSSGGAIIDALDKLREDDVQPIAILCVIDRRSGSLKNAEIAGHELCALFTMADIQG